VKKTITNIMATTGLAVVVLSVIVRILFRQNYDLFFSSTVLETFIANIVIHLGLLLTQKLEFKYFALEVLLDMTYTAVVLIILGFVFGWIDVIPVWVFVLMAVLIHLIALFLNVARIRDEANKINKLLEKRDENKESRKKRVKE